MAPDRRRHSTNSLSQLGLVLISVGAALSSCSGGDREIGAPRAQPPGSTVGAGGGSVGTGSILTVPDAAPADGPPSVSCDSTPDGDKDNDGYTAAAGDCNDCDPSVNPGAFDVPGSKVDEDCSGGVDDEPKDCEDGLPLAGDAVDAAKALGICRTAVPGATGKERTWGLVSARYVFPDGSTKSLEGGFNAQCTPDGAPHDLSHGIAHGFGTKVRPRQGTSLVILSSGVARAGKQPGPTAGRISPDGALMCTHTGFPSGFPTSSYETCGDLPVETEPPQAYDAIALELVIRAPTNAKAFTFDFDFYTFEYPEYLCGLNDTFVALLYSKSPDVPMNHNVAFDAKKNPVTVNNAFLEVCDPHVYEGTKNGMPFTRPYNCQYGTDELAGTGFESGGFPDSKTHGATGWLRSRANIVGGEEFTVRFGVWDYADQDLDSTVLLDGLAWDATPGSNETTRPPPIR